MNPTVINNNNNNSTSDPNTIPNRDTTADPNANQRNFEPTRGFQSPFSRFGFDDSDDDMFGDIDIRSRLNRLGHPFDWGARKRRGSAGFPTAAATAASNENPAAAANDPYSQYFDSDFPHFGSPQFSSAFGGRKRAGQAGETQNDRSRFFDYLPSEFRQYFPDSFGLNQMRNQMPQQAAAASPPTQQYVPQQQFAQSPPQQQQQYVQPQQQQYVQPQQQYVQPPQHQQQQQYAQVPFQQQQHQAQPQFYNTSIPVYQEPPRPKVCDASIQTENVSDELNQGSGGLQQHGLRNTVDMGQKSQQEEVRQDRAQSAPPPTDFAQSLASSFVSANDGPSYVTTGSFANTGTSMTPQAHGHKQFNYQSSNPAAAKPPPAPAQDSGASRTIPIFVEGRNVPIVPKNNEPNIQQQHQQQQQQSAPHRPQPFTPIDTTDSSSDPSSNNPPQTPHTTDCIQKIQNIQRDVLDLMSKVDKFQGIRGDKEYGYIDEMLTRNLLKLDTIDTNGRDSIRLARKEAIRCIQASITVLEAKAENNTKAAAAENVAALPSDSSSNSCSVTEGESKNAAANQDSAVEENEKEEKSNTVEANDEIPTTTTVVEQGQEATESQ